MFVRVKSKITGHEFDIHEHQFDELKHTKVKRYPLSKRVRRTKFRVGKAPAFSVSAVDAGEGTTDVQRDS